MADSPTPVTTERPAADDRRPLLPLVAACGCGSGCGCGCQSGGPCSCGGNCG
ncbi:hypothetical protein ABT381_28740 [Streptomyces sp. NPDC000151]|uniref:hypothetical protein n=1 Tax=Streptomyces sp. NPDC000151 TaxID=3154244 RepID=UPI003330A503